MSIRHMSIVSVLAKMSIANARNKNRKLEKNGTYFDDDDDSREACVGHCRCFRVMMAKIVDQNLKLKIVNNFILNIKIKYFYR